MQIRRFMLGTATGFVAGYVACRAYEALGEARRTAVSSSDDSRAYGRIRRALAVAGVARSLAGTLAFAFGPAGEFADRITSRAPRWLAPALFSIATSAAATIAEAPIGFVEEFGVERRFGLTTQSPRAWAIDYAKEGVLGATVSALLASLGAALLRKAPRAWPWLASLATLPLLVAANVVVPLYVLPWFNRFEPLEGPLEQRLRSLASRFGVGNADILRMDMSRQTKKANAFVAGIGSTHRIVLGDTLIEGFTPEEIEFVVAHELGHYVSRDTWRMTAAAQTAITALLFVAARTLRPSDLARPSLAVARIVATMGAGSQALRPLLFAFSRSREWAADRFALRATQDGAAGIAAFRRLRELNRAEETVPAWYQFFFSSHPTIGDRIAALEHR